MAIRVLFERVHHSLAGGGYFVNADQVSGETPEEEAFYREWWLRRVREAGVSEEDLAAALSRMRADRNATLGAQLLWLGEAGFEGIGCRYKDHRFAVYNGRKGYENPEDGKDEDG
jgi:tRNA (cmo5U34)-methyltransferase